MPMPTYEYVCDACEHGFDEFQSYSEEPLTKCPKCKKKKLRRLFGTGASIIFKGSGFYETDYRSESYKSAEKAEADAAKPKEESKSESKSESKAETKSESKPAAAKASKPKAGKSGSA
jgi:putative FmdB family regulatory protein